MKKGTILAIDDDHNLQLVMSQYLESEGYKVTTANKVTEALEKIEGVHTDVILLDLGLPDGEGLSLIAQLKSKSEAAIIIVSGKTDTTEKIICLEMGADDYITKPFEMRELSARIKAVTRRSSSTEASKPVSDQNNKQRDKIVFEDGWCLDRHQYQVFRPDEESADLTTGEFQLLEALVMSPNRALSRERLFELTRDGDYDVYDRAIDIQIARLRKKLNDDIDSPKLIKTVRGVGYMFSGRVNN